MLSNFCRIRTDKPRYSLIAARAYEGLYTFSFIQSHERSLSAKVEAARSMIDIRCVAPRQQTVDMIIELSGRLSYTKNALMEFSTINNAYQLA